MTYETKIIAIVAIQTRTADMRANWLKAKACKSDTRQHWRDEYIKSRKAVKEVFATI